MNEGQLPTFQKGRIYFLRGETLQKIVDSIIKDIDIDGIKTSKPRPNVCKLDIQRKSVEDCDGDKYDVLTTPTENEEEEGE